MPYLQDMSSHDIDHVEWKGSCFLSGKIWTIYRNDKKCEDVFKFPEIFLAPLELTHCGLVMPYYGIDLDQYWLR